MVRNVYEDLHTRVAWKGDRERAYVEKLCGIGKNCIYSSRIFHQTQGIEARQAIYH
jgi:hypothetical protein